MKLLLDENLPRRIKQDFQEHEVFTVRDMGWNGIKNGPLLSLMIENGFQALLTFDKNLQHQQNFQKYTIAVFILSAPINTYTELTQLSSKIKEQLRNQALPKGPIVISNNPAST
jgi:predicted nuclease of predicted toxin-antitoxin system